VAGSANQIVYKDSSNNPTSSSSLSYIGPVSGIGTLGIGTIITIKHNDTLNSGTLTFEGSAGQLFTITNNLTSGSIFSVADSSGIPSIDVNADDTVLLAPYNGNVGIGTTLPQARVHIVGNTLITGITTVGLADTSTPPNNSQLSFELTSNTNLRIKVRGTDGVLRSANITLS
jgi:hypothetical protein